jgi:hypothetical protein
VVLVEINLDNKMTVVVESNSFVIVVVDNSYFVLVVADKTFAVVDNNTLDLSLLL